METLKTITFNVPTKEEVSASNQAIFENLNKALGFVPNLYATMAYSDHALERFLNYQNAKTSFSNKEKEAINLIVSQVNSCLYCLSAHTIIGKMNGFTEAQILSIRKGESEHSKLDALVKLAKEITENKGKASDNRIQSFFNEGYTKENLVDLIIQVSEKTAMNYLHNLTNVPIDFPLAATI